MNRISLLTWPPDERDTLNQLARSMAREHLGVQVGLLKFHLAADEGHHVSDGVYMSLLASLARLSLVGSELRGAILSYRTTVHVPAVETRG